MNESHLHYEWFIAEFDGFSIDLPEFTPQSIFLNIIVAIASPLVRCFYFCHDLFSQIKDQSKNTHCFLLKIPRSWAESDRRESESEHSSKWLIFFVLIPVSHPMLVRTRVD